MFLDYFKIHIFAMLKRCIVLSLMNRLQNHYAILISYIGGRSLYDGNNKGSFKNALYFDNNPIEIDLINWYAWRYTNLMPEIDCDFLQHWKLPFLYIKDGCNILLICPHDWSSDWWTKFIHITLVPTTNHIYLIETFLMLLQFLDADFIADDELLTFDSTFGWMNKRF